MASVSNRKFPSPQKNRSKHPDQGTSLLATVLRTLSVIGKRSTLLAGIVCPATACTLCHSSSAETLRQSILSNQGCYYAALVVCPFPAFLAIIAFIWHWLPL